MTTPATIDDARGASTGEHGAGPAQGGAGPVATPGRAHPEPVVAAALALLDQCAGFIAQVPDEAYTGASRAMPGGTVGKHLRHTLDHYSALLVGGTRTEPVDYDHRSRDVPMETDRSEALRVLAEVRRRVGAYTAPALSAEVHIRVMLSAAGDEAVLRSTVGRELAFATHHAIHHQAMMKTIAAEHGCRASEAFGRAPATLHHDHAVVGRA